MVIPLGISSVCYLVTSSLWVSTVFLCISLSLSSLQATDAVAIDNSSLSSGGGPYFSALEPTLYA